ncbi:hypothetical protein GALL_434820 [mine drainage metagenome]|uniref:Uncharacterized protein n=1 Tax=mine drainage metagenome TaxID=410659 RepID=A0A1J5QBI7_9ZZZZ
MDAASAAGTASDSAHGQLTTSTATSVGTMRDGSSHHHSNTVSAATPSKPSVNHCAATSANCAERGLLASACCIRSTIWAMRVPAPVCVARSTSGDCRFMLPASTASPSALCTGLLSPVSKASSTSDAPEITTPSTAAALPLGSSTSSPTRTWVIATLRQSSLPGGRTRTAAGSCSINSSAAFRLRWRSPSSISRAVNSKARNITTESKYTMLSPRATLHMLAANALHSPRVTGTSIPRRRLRTSRSAPTRKGQPENNSAGRVSARLAHWKSPRSAAFRPVGSTYPGQANIITCIIASQATRVRSTARRRARRFASSLWCRAFGSGR